MSQRTRGKDRGARTLTADVRLYCGHVVLFQRNYVPEGGEVVWCVRCQRETYATVTHS